MKITVATVFTAMLSLQISLMAPSALAGDAAAETQLLLEQIKPAVGPRGSEGERRAILSKTTAVLASLTPHERLLVTDQVLAAIGRAEKDWQSDFSTATNLTPVLALGGVVGLFAAHEMKSPGTLGGAFAAIVSAALLKIAIVRPETLRAHVIEMRSELEILRDSQRRALEAGELK